MSLWDSMYRHRSVQEAERGLRSRDFTYTFSFVASPRRLWRMMTYGERDVWTKSDIVDLAQFCEDFVLFDHIGVLGTVADLIGPSILYASTPAQEYPLFDSTNQLDDCFRFLRRHDEPEHNCRPEDYEKFLRLLPNFSEEDLETWRDRRKSQNKATLRLIEESVELKQKLREIIHDHLTTLSPRLDSEWAFSPNHINYMANELGRATNLLGLSVSPGSAFDQLFRRDVNSYSFARRAYLEVSSTHQELAAKLQLWSTRTAIDVPPLLSILLSRCKSRELLISELVALRLEFSDLRRSLREAQNSFDSAASLNERIRAVERIETLRRTLLKKATKNTASSVVQRTWSIVKKGSIIGILTELADLVLDFGGERQLVGGLRRFVDIERLALSGDLSSSSISRLFGNIQTN